MHNISLTTLQSLAAKVSKLRLMEASSDGKSITGEGMLTSLALGIGGTEHITGGSFLVEVTKERCSHSTTECFVKP